MGSLFVSTCPQGEVFFLDMALEQNYNLSPFVVAHLTS